mmetsp:Transcript_27929/g.82094  ORF Transcript_27929/g.82094 Transcript_27929/m.82094 type:complete len:216 (-) Transcript_27929:2492-3139(-)
MHFSTSVQGFTPFASSFSAMGSIIRRFDWVSWYDEKSSSSTPSFCRGGVHPPCAILFSMASFAVISAMICSCSYSDRTTSLVPTPLWMPAAPPPLRGLRYGLPPDRILELSPPLSPPYSEEELSPLNLLSIRPLSEPLPSRLLDRRRLSPPSLSSSAPSSCCVYISPLTMCSQHKFSTLCCNRLFLLRTCSRTSNPIRRYCLEWCLKKGFSAGST